MESKPFIARHYLYLPGILIGQPDTFSEFFPTMEINAHDKDVACAGDSSQGNTFSTNP
jgi:hypothetical protein